MSCTTPSLYVHFNTFFSDGETAVEIGLRRKKPVGFIAVRHSSLVHIKFLFYRDIVMAICRLCSTIGSGIYSIASKRPKRRRTSSRERLRRARARPLAGRSVVLRKISHSAKVNPDLSQQLKIWTVCDCSRVHSVTVVKRLNLHPATTVSLVT